MLYALWLLLICTTLVLASNVLSARSPLEVALTATAVARAVGQAVATAHMADHSLGAALYALKAPTAADQSSELEGRWQLERLPVEIRELVVSALRAPRLKSFSPVTLEP